MNFLILAFFIIFLIVQQSSMVFAENEETDLENSTIDMSRSSYSSKIHPILMNWQISESPVEFAKMNSLSFKDNKVAVYIHLESTESGSKIPPEINVTAFDEKIALAFVSSEQLDQLDDLDFVKRITPPERIRILPLPQDEIPETKIPEENQYDYLVWIAIGGIVIFTIIAILKKRQKLHNQN